MTKVGPIGPVHLIAELGIAQQTASQPDRPTDRPTLFGLLETETLGEPMNRN